MQHTVFSGRFLEKNGIDGTVSAAQKGRAERFLRKIEFSEKYNTIIARTAAFGKRMGRGAGGRRDRLRAGVCMRLFDEIVTRLGADADVCFGGAKAVLLVGKCAYFENVRGIVSLSAEEAVLAFAGVRLRVTGRGMTVARYGGGDLLLAGDVRGVEAEDQLPQPSASASREKGVRGRGDPMPTEGLGDVRGGGRSLTAGDVRGVEAEG